MKRFSIFLWVVMIFVAQADQARTPESLEARTVRRVQETPPALDANKPIQIKSGKFSYSGIAVEAVKVDMPLELLNPAASRQYGLAEANIVREPADGRISGLKIFSIEF